MAAAALAANLKLQGTLRDGLARLGPLVEETAVKRQAALEDLLSVAYVTVDPNYMEKEWDEEVTEEMIDDCERRGALERSRAKKAWSQLENRALWDAVCREVPETRNWERIAAFVQAATWGFPDDRGAGVPASYPKKRSRPKEIVPPRTPGECSHQWDEIKPHANHWELWEEQHLLAAVEANQGHRWDIVAASAAPRQDRHRRARG